MMDSFVECHHEPVLRVLWKSIRKVEETSPQEDHGDSPVD